MFACVPLTKAVEISLLAKQLQDELIENIDFFKLKPMNKKKITILVDQGYHPNTIMKALKEVYPAIDKKVKFQVSEKISREEKGEKGLTGFVPEKMRWIIETHGLKDIRA